MNAAAFFVGHLDADCFYVSAERVRDPFLGDKPVGVLGNQGACVIAKSYEMKAAGVQTGMPIWEALKKCPQGIYLQRDFRWYEVLSRRMLEMVRQLSPRVEYYSIDEFFFEAAPLGAATWTETAGAIRDRIRRDVGVPVTVGIARTKTLAKLISDSAKPFGAQAVLDREAETALLAGLPVTDISGIAQRRAERLAALGVRTCLDFARADRRRVRRLLTRAGETLWWELNGTPVQPILTDRPPHQILSRGGSLGGAVTDPALLHAWLVRNLERLIEELDYHGVQASRLTVWLGYKTDSGPTATSGDMPLTVPSARFDLLLEAARLAFDRAWRPGLPVARMHLIAAGLQLRHGVQLGLFEPPAARAETLARLKRDVNARHGRFALRSAATLPLGDLYHNDAHDYDICDVRGKMCF